MPGENEDPRLVERVREALAGVRKVSERRMFGGTGFMVRGHLCVSALDKAGAGIQPHSAVTSRP